MILVQHRPVADPRISERGRVQYNVGGCLGSHSVTWLNLGWGFGVKPQEGEEVLQVNLVFVKDDEHIKRYINNFQTGSGRGGGCRQFTSHV
jgi:hypothetical protein